MTYSTVQGDMWDSIAFKLLGDESYSVQLMQANPQHGNITIFPSGIVLQVPTITEEVDSDLPPWKQVST